MQLDRLSSPQFYSNTLGDIVNKNQNYFGFNSVLKCLKIRIGSWAGGST